MSKERVYFSHDADALSDYKMIMLTSQLRMEGYGIYWAIIEMLRSQPEYKLPLAIIPGLSVRFSATPAIIEAVIRSYDLFKIEGDFFFSASLNRRMGVMEEKRESKRIAGIRSGEARRKKRDQRKLPSGTNVEQCSNTVQTNEEHSSNTVRTKDEQNEQNKIKETKVNTLLTESDNKEHSLTPTLELLEVDFLREKCLTAPIWFEDAKRLLKLEGGTLFGLIGQFTDFLKARGENFKQESDFKKHFISWALIEIKKNHGTNQYKTDSDRRDIAKKNLTHRFVTGATIAGEISNSEIPV